MNVIYVVTVFLLCQFNHTYSNYKYVGVTNFIFLLIYVISILNNFPFNLFLQYLCKIVQLKKDDMGFLNLS